MSTLAGQKIKDKYGNLLQVEGGITTTLKNVEDGTGDVTALKLSTTAVGVSSLTFNSAPSTDDSELTGLFVDGSNNVVKRELDASAFSSATVTFANPMWVLRPSALYTLTASATTPTQAAVNNGSNASSHEVNDTANHFQTSSTTIGAVTVQRAGLVKIDVNFMLEVTSGNTDIIIDVTEKRSGGSAAIIQSITRGHASTGNTAIGFSLVRHVDADTDLYYTIRNSGGGASMLTTSTFILTKLD
jgi:hypothetical protein